MERNKDIVFFTSDTHFGHNNIIKYCNRPFMSKHEQAVVDAQIAFFESAAGKCYLDQKEKARELGEDFPREPEEVKECRKLRISQETVEKHDETIIANWNSVVPENGVVFHLGDFCWGRDRGPILDLINRLNGRIYLVKGNHDHSTNLYQDKMGWIKDYFLLKVKDDDASDGVRKVCLMHFAMRVWDASHYGSYHLYGHSHGTLEEDPDALSMDVGVDVWGFSPISYNDVAKYLNKKSCKPYDPRSATRNRKR